MRMHAHSGFDSRPPSEMDCEDDFQDRATGVPSEVPTPQDTRRPARLHLVHPPELATVIELGHQERCLGRQPEPGGALILHRLVSRKHFAVRWRASEGVHVGIDLGSRCGSRVDGTVAERPTPLLDGSVIRLGPVLLVYEAGRSAWAASTEETATDAIPGQSYAAQALRARVAAVATDPSPVLLQGETGTGKEHVAREVHRLSQRHGRFVALNCAALAPELVESELFGHVRGAFSGASHDSKGLFRAAEGGTLFLDEVGELPASVQPKLLRTLQEFTVRPVGATRDVPVDVRIIAATHRDLGALVATGAFRRDLHARLGLWELEVPPLRARRPDLLGWHARLRARFAAQRTGQTRDWPTLTGAAAECVLRHEFADNLRGLDRLVHAQSLSVNASMDVGDLPDWIARRETPALGPAAEVAEHDPMLQSGAVPVFESLHPSHGGHGSGQPTRVMAAPDREGLARTLAHFGGSVRATAKHYGRDRKQIYRWLRAHGLRD